MSVNMHIEELRAKELIILECLSGSRAYGLHTASSDTDIKGVFLLPKKDFYGLNYIKQVSDESNDTVFYELGRFMELLSVNNPNILELLNTPTDAVIYKSELLREIDSQKIISRLCKDTFGKFALSQIRKAKGLKKKIVNPVDKERKTPLDFCFVSKEAGSIPLQKFLQINSWQQQDCGLAKISNMENLYGLFHNPNLDYSGIIRGEDSNSLALSSIPKGQALQALLYFNMNGYSTYCKHYREYWDWVEKRNEHRYNNTKSHGKNYDSKNMMHTFRLLNMAIEIAEEKRINVRRADRDFLLQVKAGEYEYEELLKMAEDKQAQMEKAFEKSDLPDRPDLAYIEDLSYRLRDRYYRN